MLLTGSSTQRTEAFESAFTHLQSSPASALLGILHLPPPGQRRHGKVLRLDRRFAVKAVDRAVGIGGWGLGVASRDFFKNTSNGRVRCK